MNWVSHIPTQSWHAEFKLSASSCGGMDESLVMVVVVVVDDDDDVDSVPLHHRCT